MAALPANALHRIGKLFGAKPNEAVFTPAEVRQLQHAVCTELGLDVSWALQTYDRTPYFFNLMSAMASCLQDVDAVLPSTLSQGAPTGVREQIPPSGVWPAKGTPLAPDCALELCMCDNNHASATAEPTKVTALLEQEIAQGFVEKVQGGHAELLERFSAEDLAIGKLGLVSRPGKEDRLIGDSRASGASPAASFAEKAEVPALGNFTQALDKHAAWFGRPAQPSD